MKIKISSIIKLSIGICIFYSLTRSLCADLFGAYANITFLLLMSVLMLGYFITYKEQLIKLNNDRFFIGLSIYIFVIIVNLLMGKESSYYALFEYVFYALFIFAVLFTIRFVSIGNILSLYERFGVFLAVEAIWEYITGNILYRPYTDFQSLRRAYGLIGSPLTLGMVLACISIIALYRGKHENKYHYCVGIICMIGMMSTQSRGPFISLIVGLVIATYVDEIIRTKRLLNTTIILLFRVIVVLTSLYFLASFLANYNSTIRAIMERISSILVWNQGEVSNYARTQRWRDAIQLFLERPIFGLGVSSTGPHANTGIITESGILKKLVEIGFLGFIIYYLLYAGGIMHFFRIVKKSNQPYVGLSFGVIIAIFVENIIMQIVESAAIYLIFSLFFCHLFLTSHHVKSKEKMN